MDKRRHRTDTPGVYRRGRSFHVVFRDEGRWRCRAFPDYDTAVFFKTTMDTRRRQPQTPAEAADELRAARRAYDAACERLRQAHVIARAFAS